MSNSQSTMSNDQNTISSVLKLFLELWAERASAELRRRDRSAEFPLFLEEEIEAIKPLLREEFGDIYQKYETEHFWELLTFGELLEKIKENGILPIQNSYFTWRDIRNVFQHYNKKIYKNCQKQHH
ncbi:unnamed protein product [Trichogramma brassicae]|uniref:Uncharacterized protein n=1 Tax=Trichogramma brassicae TaxID=86971 RepID=A0A6H5ILW4_9HYME|nr:unnamed protein product [Trichogramma brassicae]